jgi:hypothetical protein
LIAARRPIDHVLAIERSKAPATLQIGSDDFRHIERRCAGRLPAKGHDRDRHGIFLTARDFDHQLRSRARGGQYK